MISIGPKAILLELTHRCPLHCPYCYNPTQLAKKQEELPVTAWQKVIREAAALGVHQLSFSGGEPLLYRGLPTLIRTATEHGLYTNLITSGIGLTNPRLDELKQAGLQHIQMSIQGPDKTYDTLLSGLPGAFEYKSLAAHRIMSTGIPLTLNWVMCAQNITALPEVIFLAKAWRVHRLELAMAQFHGWALINRQALFPSLPQIKLAEQQIVAAQRNFRGQFVIDYVPNDYTHRYPKPCMDGWGQKLMVINPAGEALPCHLAKSLPLTFDKITDRALEDIWKNSAAFNHYRGTHWLPETCQACPRKMQDWGGCRCQAFALTGDPNAIDPACQHSPHHIQVSPPTLSKSIPLVFRKQNFIKKEQETC